MNATTKPATHCTSDHIALEDGRPVATANVDAAADTGARLPRIYIAGPMSGLAQFNYPAFNVAAAKLRALGYEVENPAENPKPESETWGNYMRLALTQMLTCDCVALLPGWPQSRGALLEHFIAQTIGLHAAPVETFF